MTGEPDPAASGDVGDGGGRLDDDELGRMLHGGDAADIEGSRPGLGRRSDAARPLGPASERPSRCEGPPPSGPRGLAGLLLGFAVVSTGYLLVRPDPVDPVVRIHLSGAAAPVERGRGDAPPAPGQTVTGHYDVSTDVEGDKVRVLGVLGPGPEPPHGGRHDRDRGRRPVTWGSTPLSTAPSPAGGPPRPTTGCGSAGWTGPGRSPSTTHRSGPARRRGARSCRDACVRLAVSRALTIETTTVAATPGDPRSTSAYACTTRTPSPCGCSPPPPVFETPTPADSCRRCRRQVHGLDRPDVSADQLHGIRALDQPRVPVAARREPPPSCRCALAWSRRHRNLRMRTIRTGRPCSSTRSWSTPSTTERLARASAHPPHDRRHRRPAERGNGQEPRVAHRPPHPGGRGPALVRRCS